MEARVGGFRYECSMTVLRVAFHPVPMARWGSLFHILLLEAPDVRLQWAPRPFPSRDRSLLDGADVGVFLQPPPHPELSSIDVGASRMAVVMAAGHRLGRVDELRVADVIDEPFLDDPRVDPAWKAFWTLDAYRGGPPTRVHGGVTGVEQAIEPVASGRAIATFPESLAAGLPHPGLIWLPLADGPRVAIRLVWRADERSPAVGRLVDIARALFASDPPHAPLSREPDRAQP
jgi:DNA-binding transcriptional LysR family regulator